MRLEEIQSNWESDVQIDRTELGDESLRIAKMHSKYYKMFSHERLTLRRMEADYKELYRDKYEWYNGSISQETLQLHGWQPNPLKILRTDISMHIDADKDMQTAALRIELQREKVEFLESIIKSLVSMGFNIKNAIEWAKFQSGV